jgi:hypothetical protein
VGCPRPEATLTVQCTTGTAKVLMALTVETAFLSRRSRSIEWTAASWEGW